MGPDSFFFQKDTVAFIVEVHRRILKVTDLKIPGNWRMRYDYVALLQQMP